MDGQFDSLRVYRLREPKPRHLRLLGAQPRFDLAEPLII
jgi:hypothetical protein